MIVVRNGRVQTPRTEHGAAAVEFALVAPLLMFVIFALVDVGMMFHTKASIAAGAREAVRSSMYDSLATTTSIATRINDFTTFDVAAAQITYTPCPATTNPAFSTSRAKVVVAYPYRYLTPIDSLAGFFGIPMTSTVTINETATFRCLG